MRKTPQPLPCQKLFVYAAMGGGGCVDVGQITMDSDVGLYSRYTIEEMRIHERMFYVRYMQMVLVAIGHNREEQTSND